LVSRGISRNKVDAQPEREQSDRQVDEKRGAPTELQRQPAAERGSHGESQIRHHGLQTQHLTALGGWKVFRQDRRRVGKEHRRAERLQRTRGDKRERVRRYTTQRRGNREDHKA